MKNASIKLKLTLATFPSLIILIICIIFYTIVVNATMNQSENLYYDKLYNINSNLVNADRDFYQAFLASTKQFSMESNGTDSLTQDLRKQNVDDYQENTQQVAERVEEAIAIAKADETLWNAKTEDGRTFAECSESFNSAFAAWQESYDPAGGVVDEGKFIENAEQFDSARDYLDDMTEITESWAEMRKASLQAYVKKTLIKVISFFAVLSVIMTVWTLYLTRLIGNSIRVVSEKLSRLSNYDLAQEPIYVDSKDELGVMKKAFNDTQSALQNIIGTLRNTSNGLITASGVVSEGTDATGVGIDNVSSAADDLANASTSMAQDVSDISNNMVELSAIMERSVESAESLSEASAQIGKVTKTGNEVVEELAGINERSYAEFNAIFEAIDDIKKSGEKISEASELILNIADQTNLLSLNASIEAARAGEAGKGFAVVADEIRNLSDESKENVDTINEILAELSRATNNASQKADVVKDFVQKQNDAVGQTRESFGAIVTTVEGVESAIAELEQINTELNAKSREIGESVGNLSALSEENAATSQELSATAQTVQTSVEELKHTQGDVEVSSDELSNIVGRFIVEDDSADQDAFEDVSEATKETEEIEEIK